MFEVIVSLLIAGVVLGGVIAIIQRNRRNIQSYASSGAGSDTGGIDDWGQDETVGPRGEKEPMAQ